MNIAAFLLAAVAFIVFGVVFVREWRATRRVAISLGLALLTLAWIVQQVWDTTHTVHGS